MLNKTLIAGLAVCLLMGAGLAAAAKNDDPTTTTTTMTDAKAKGADAAAAGKVHKDARLCDRDAGCRHLGAFRETDGTVSGRNVGFVVDAATGVLRDYTSRGAWGDEVILSSLSFATYDGANASEKVHGPVYALRDAPDATFLAFDAKNAAFVVHSKDGNVVTLVVPADVDVQTFEKRSGWSPAGALLTRGEHSAKLVLRGDASLSSENGTLTVTLGKGASMWFRIVGHPGEVAKEGKALKHLQESRRSKKADKARKE